VLPEAAVVVVFGLVGLELQVVLAVAVLAVQI
jgi:hypothetical protein